MSKYCYCIDAGHAEETPGKRSPKFPDGSQLFEYEFNRAVAAKLIKKLIANNISYFVVTPESVKDVGLTIRAKRVNEHKCGKPKILISIHANAHGMGKEFTPAQGWCVFTTKGQNNSDKVADIFWDEHTKMFPDRRMRKDTSDGDKDIEADFTIIKLAKCMAVLTENFFMTNEEEARLLMTDEFREKIAEAHFRAILQIEKTL